MRVNKRKFIKIPQGPMDTYILRQLATVGSSPNTSRQKITLCVLGETTSASQHQD
jgi:hypothetical protein